MKTTLSGFSLVEVVIALGIASVTLVPILGLMPIGLNSSLSATSQTNAVNILTAVATDLHNTPESASGAAPASPLYGLPLNTSSTLYFDQGGGFTSQPSLGSRYRLTVTPVTAGTVSKRATPVTITVSWPAKAASANALGVVNACVNLDRN